MASDVGGYMSSGGHPESGRQSERRSLDEGDRRKASFGRKFAKLSLEDKPSLDSSVPAIPVALRLEPWGYIPDPPKERHEYIKKLLGEPQEGHRLSRLLGGDSSHHHHHNTRASSPSSSPLSRSTSLSRTLSRIGSDKNPVAKTSLTDCFKRFASVEVLDGDNKFACEECAKVHLTAFIANSSSYIRNERQRAKMIVVPTTTSQWQAPIQSRHQSLLSARPVVGP